MITDETRNELSEVMGSERRYIILDPATADEARGKVRVLQAKRGGIRYIAITDDLDEAKNYIAYARLQQDTEHPAIGVLPSKYEGGNEALCKMLTELGINSCFVFGSKCSNGEFIPAAKLRATFPEQFYDSEERRVNFSAARGYLSLVS